MTVKKIVVCLPKFIGDSIMATSALQLLKSVYADAEITVICRRLNADIFERSQYQVIRDPRDGNKIKGIPRLTKIIKQGDFDLGVLFSNTFVDALCFKLAGIQSIVGYRNEGRTWLLDKSLKINRARHYINHYCYLVNMLAATPFEKLPQVSISHGDCNHIAALPNGDRKVVCCYFGGENKGSRHYPIAQSVAVVQRLIDLGYFVVLTGDPTEQDTSAQLVRQISSAHAASVKDLTGKTSIIELVDFIAASDVLISIDSSPIHIAAAVNTPMITLVGGGTSAWSMVEPKVAFASYVVGEGHVIADEQQLWEVTPAKVLAEFKRRFV